MPQPPNTRKTDILEVAISLFRARGYHGTRMDDIADSAKLNKATVYYYFASKADILHAIYVKATNETLEVLHEADHDLSAADALRVNAKRQLELIARDLDQAAVYFQEAPFLREWLTKEQVTDIRRRERRFERGVRQIIDRGFSDGSFAGTDPAIATAAYVGMTSWFYRWYDPKRTGKPDEIAAAFSQIFLRGLMCAEEAASS